jgi:BirA family biotin operon repressor/biotin-[acetyl-CoA-carboxylase] ligase
MSLPRSRKLVPELIELDSSPSTNGALVALAAIPATEDFTTVVTRDQTAGRGRLGRAWVAPPGASLAISVLLRPRTRGRDLPLERYGWLPIAAGVAMTETIRQAVSSATVGFKWPNDVLIGGRKVCGVLGELIPARAPTGGTTPLAAGVVLGAGVNISMSEAELPVPTATSLALAGAHVDRSLEDRILSGYLGHLRTLVTDYLEAGGDADASGLRPLARELCITLGRSVRVELPDGAQLVGTATDLDADGRLMVTEANGRERSVAAGDVTHVR